MSRATRKGAIGGAFVAHPLELRRSPAWRALSDEGRRVLARLELEHMEHGGASNGACGAAGEGVTTDADPARPGGAMRDEARPCKPDCNLAESGADGLGLSRLPLTMFIFPSTNVEAKMNTELAHAHRGEKAD